MALQGRLSCDEYERDLLSNLTWLEDYIEEDCPVNATIDPTKVCACSSDAIPYMVVYFRNLIY